MLRNDRDAETGAHFGWRPEQAELGRCERYIVDATSRWRTGEGGVFAVRESASGPLVGVLLGWCAREGIPEIWAHVEKGNRGSARLAAKSGFEIVGEDDRWS
jgi:hypothetical protein